METPSYEQGKATAPPLTEIRPVGVAGRRVLWPVAIGAISIAWGALKALSLMQILLNLLSGLLRGTNFSGLASGNLPGMVYFCALLLMGILGAGVLLPGGILLWRQSRAGEKMLLVWAIFAILLAATQPIAMVFVYPESMRLYFAIQMGWQATVSMTWPVFLLIWLSRPKVRDEMRLWR